METLSITEARTNLSELVRRVHTDNIRVGITVQGRVQAVLGSPEPSGTLGPWVQVAKSFNGSGDLPKPLNDRAVDDGGVHPVLWLNTTTGAMVGAIATGRWDTPGARFYIHYAHPALPDTIPMLDWTYRLPAWSGKDPDECDRIRLQVIDLLRDVLPHV